MENAVNILSICARWSLTRHCRSSPLAFANKARVINPPVVVDTTPREENYIVGLIESLFGYMRIFDFSQFSEVNYFLLSVCQKCEAMISRTLGSLYQKRLLKKRDCVNKTLLEPTKFAQANA